MSFSAIVELLPIRSEHSRERPHPRATSYKDTCSQDRVDAVCWGSMAGQNFGTYFVPSEKWCRRVWKKPAVRTFRDQMST